MSAVHRQYCRTLLSVALGAWATVLLLNAAVDPFEVIGTGWLARPAEPQERFLKIRLLEADRRFDTFLLGNSRIGTTRTEDVERWFPGSHAYNLTAAQANAWDANVLARWLAHERGRVRRLFVQVDFPVTSGPVKPGHTLLTAMPPAISGESEAAFRLRYVVSFAPAAIGAKVLANTGLATPAAYDFDKGYWSRPELDAAIATDCAGFARAEPAFHRATPAPSPSAERRRLIDAEMRELRELVAFARARGIEIALFVPPLHRRLLDAFNIDDYAYFLRSLAGISEFRLFGFYSPITTSDCNYYEASHYRPVVGEHIFRLMAQPPADGAEMRSVRTDNVDSVLAFVRDNFARGRGHGASTARSARLSP